MRMPLYFATVLYIFFEHHPPLTNSTQLCLIFGSEPDMKTVVWIWKSLSSKCGYRCRHHWSDEDNSHQYFSRYCSKTI